MVRLYELLDNGEIRFVDYGVIGQEDSYLKQGYIITPMCVNLIDEEE